MPAGTSHALRQPAAVDRLMAAPMARRTTDTQREGRWDTREPPARLRGVTCRARSQASCRGGARGPARCRRGDRRVQRRRPSNEERQLTPTKGAESYKSRSNEKRLGPLDPGGLADEEPG
jgi:hypothetical protein